MSFFSFKIEFVYVMLCLTYQLKKKLYSKRLYEKYYTLETNLFLSIEKQNRFFIVTNIESNLVYLID